MLDANDKRFLLKIGYQEKDFQQIQEAMKKKVTTYELIHMEKCNRISREQAIAVLGRECFLSGLARSAFHWTACRTTAAGESVMFDSRKLFQ